ncbi:MAG: ATP-binding cassette domain-containing protein [Gammaproteobacteria bacterium]|nr:ATP-binding cassette domain-containing protein [Gammaproteobacteria bacterium]
MIELGVENCDIGWDNRENLLVKDCCLHLQFTGNRRALPIVGRSGLGKSTLLYLISGLKKPLNPEASIVWTNQGNSIVEFSSSDPDNESLYGKHFSYAFQNAALLPFLTIKENIQLYLQNAGIPEDDAEQRSENILVRLYPRLHGNIRDKYPSQLSGGQQQRAALGKCIASDAKIIFADEPTGTLDRTTRKDILELVSEWMGADSDRCFIWVTHHEDEKEILNAPWHIEISENRVSLVDCD